MNINGIVGSVDSLRADIIGCNGDKERSTSWYDQFTQRGEAFSQVIVERPYTTTFLLSLLTGHYHIRLKFGPSSKTVSGLSGSLLILANWLKYAGHQVAAFHLNPLLSRVFGHKLGFDNKLLHTNLYLSFDGMCR